jgi:hypothetical protein
MPVEPAQWEKITPQQLFPAVKHVRKSFDTLGWRYSEVTKCLCYAALHPDAVAEPFLAEHEAAFTAYYLEKLDRAAQLEFDRMVEIGTPPSLVKAYLDVHSGFLMFNILKGFSELLQIGLSNRKRLKVRPVEWAEAHIELLIKQRRPVIKRWLREVCDKDEGLETVKAMEDLDRWIGSKNWQAPMLIRMEPFGNMQYDSAAAWKRHDETMSQQLLESLSGRFIQSLEVALENIAGETHVRLSQKGERQKHRSDQSTVHLDEHEDTSTKSEPLQPRNKERSQELAPFNVVATTREAVVEKVRNPQRYTLLTTPEAAVFFEVKPRTIHRWKSAGELRGGARRGSITINSVISLEKKRTKRRGPSKPNATPSDLIRQR